MVFKWCRISSIHRTPMFRQPICPMRCSVSRIGYRSPTHRLVESLMSMAKQANNQLPRDSVATASYPIEPF